MRTHYAVTAASDEPVRNHRTTNKSYAGFYMFVAGMIATAIFLINFFMSL